MQFIHRSIESELLFAAKRFPALLLTGPRRAGKTTLLRKLFPKASYFLLEDPDTIARLRADPRAFMEEIRLPAILDEIQNVPELLNYIRSNIDRFSGKKGEWLLTGSQEAPLMKGVTESMAGRVAIFHLLPFSSEETERVSILKGGFPEVLSQPSALQIWFRSYIQTYLERDVRSVSSIRDLATFRRFLSLLASRSGQILNKTDLAAPMGVSVPTITEWLNILEVTAQIFLVPPYFENFGKRIVKSPKLYFVDSGLLCFLLGIESESQLKKSPFYGSLFEGFVASEIIKHQLNSGRQRELYYFRDQQGLEVDFLIPQGDNNVVLADAKASQTILPRMGEPLARLAKAMKGKKISSFLVYQQKKVEAMEAVVYPGVRGVGISEFLARLR